MGCRGGGSLTGGWDRVRISCRLRLLGRDMAKMDITNNPTQLSVRNGMARKVGRIWIICTR